MQKTTLWILVAAVVIIGGYFLIKSNKGADTMGNVNSETNTLGQAQVEQGGDKTSISKLMKEGKTYICEYRQTGADNSVSQTIYVNGQTFRVEGTAKTATTNLVSNFLVKDGYFYTWNSMMEGKGSKVKIPTATEANPNAMNPLTAFIASLDELTKMPGYNCKAWTADVSKFNPPANITFIGS